ncbi:MAG: CHAD domain-containing protein [Campylobacterota bacterium]
MKTDVLIKYLIYQLYRARLKLSGVSAASDPEELHQFRVALRRSRSLLQLYLPKSDAIHDVIKTMFRPTNILRELDVLLHSLEKNDYPKLYKQLRSYRNRQYKLITPDIYIEHNTNLLEKLIDELLTINTAYTDKTLIQKALKYYKKTNTAYKALAPDTPPKKLHELRIKFKTARYALELLKENGLSHNDKKIDYAKKKQDELGAIQDAHSQLVLLKTFCKTCKLDECRHLYKARKKEYKALVKTAMSNRSD